MKNKILRYTLNSVILAAMAAIGIAAYQIGTAPTEDNIIQNVENEDMETEELAMLNDALEESELDVSDLNNEEEIDFEEVGSSEVEATKTTEFEVGVSDEDEISEETSVDSDLIDIEVAEDWESVDTSSQALLEQLSFTEATVQWPVHGEVLLDYDMTQSVYYPTLDQYRLSSAIAVKAEKGESVTAAATGIVSSIMQDARTGNTVIMELGDGYQAIYGQLDNLTISEGELVQEGTIIGYVSAPTKYYSVEGSNLYFAMKQNGEPVNPLDYLTE